MWVKKKSGNVVRLLAWVSSYSPRGKENPKTEFMDCSATAWRRLVERIGILKGLISHLEVGL